MRALMYLTCAVGILSALPGCSKDEMEDEDWCLDPRYLVPLEVHVNCKPAFSDYLTIDTVYNTRAYGPRNEESLALKYYVAAFPKREDRLPSVVASSSTPNVPIEIHPGKYTLVGWADYEYPGKEGAMNFYTDDFRDLLLKNKYTYFGESPLKLGFRGAEERTIPYNASRDSLTVTPAMAKYRIVATDTAVFTPAKVVIKYKSALPAAIDAQTGRINWWWDDISYTTIVNGTVLATDFVLSHDDEETSVTVAVEIYDEKGQLRARKKDLKIPLRNGGTTTVRGNFYSVLERENSIGGSGITIKTEWDDTFEIEL